MFEDKVAKYVLYIRKDRKINIKYKYNKLARVVFRTINFNRSENISVENQ